MRLDIIIPVHNQISFLNQCLESIIQTCPSKHLVSVRIIDSASTEQIPAWIRNPHLNPILPLNMNVFYTRLDQNMGVTIPWNLGLDAAMKSGADAICVCNSDVIFGVGAIEKCMRALEEHQVGAVWPLSIQGGPLPGDFRQRAADNDKKELTGSIVDTGGFAGWCFFLKRSTVEKVGRFDEQFILWYQDTDYHYRLHESNVQHAEVKACLLHHFESRTIVSMPGGFDCHGWRKQDERRFFAKWPGQK